MNKVQTSKSNSLVKIEDFLDDHAAELAVVVQIEPLHEELKDVIEDIGTAMALAEQDNTGYTINKNRKGNEVKRKSLPTADFTNHRVSQSKNGVSQSYK